MKLITLKTGLLFTLMIALGTLAANAQSKGERREPPTFKELLEQMDKNEDGQLAKDEVKGPLQNGFDKIDLDKDGFITEEELEKAPKPKGRPRN
ncbi:EF-hand domain-containing protein [Maribacter sp. LLG6340-A2]|uniref:EF-hand domain-containing protein n=1 Tax=Maribacter sp. LLG6340-A2 TaxID=3160834 RepID=UPI003866EF6F